jgi:hypothetical protein
MRYARKTDSTQADIVKGLREHYVRVWVIGEPCDLLCHYWDNRTRSWRWQPLECKPLTGKRAPKARIRRDQAAQTAFLVENEVPVVTSLDRALQALGINRQAGMALTA